MPSLLIEFTDSMIILSARQLVRLVAGGGGGGGVGVGF